MTVLERFPIVCVLYSFGLFKSFKADVKIEFKTAEGLYSREQAENVCTKIGSDYMLPADDGPPETRRYLLELLTKDGQKIWLDPKRNVLPNLIDSDGRQFEGKRVLTKPRHADRNCYCAMLYPNREETPVEPFSCTAACHKRTHICVRAICQSKVRGRQGNCTCRDESADDTDCLQLNGTCLHIARHPTSWYSARAQCQRQGMTLVQVRTDQDVRQLSSALKQHRKEKGGSGNGLFFWLDLNQEQWLYTRDNETFEVNQNYWAAQPKTAKGNCVTLTYKQGRILWEVTECAEHHQVVCQRRFRPTKVTTVGPGTDTGQASTGSATTEEINSYKHSDRQTGDRASQNGVNVTGIVVPIVVIAVLGVVIVAVIIKYKERICGGQPTSETEENKEMMVKT